MLTLHVSMHDGGQKEMPFIFVCLVLNIYIYTVKKTSSVSLSFCSVNTCSQQQGNLRMAPATKTTVEDDHGGCVCECDKDPGVRRTTR